ncbi:MAG: two-component sensor histidine kinase [Saprospiraceae bacterium]|jgi:two-component sensor histidine kinase
MVNSDDILEGDSFGYSLINSFANKLEAVLTIKVEKGTAFEMIIDNYQKI